MAAQHERQLIAKELDLGFLYIPASISRHFPRKNGTMALYLGEARRPTELTYNAKFRRVFGLTKWYRRMKLSPKDVITIDILDNGEIHLSTARARSSQSYSEEEVKEIVDLSGLSSTAKGDIVEDRVKEQILLYGQGLLNVYKPVSDTEGIDLIVLKNGVFQPIFLQVKGRFNLQKSGAFLCDVRMKTFRPHHTFFVVGAYFNPATLALYDNLLFVPTEVVAREGIAINVRGQERRRVTTALSTSSKSKWARYVCPKQDLVNRILDKFAEIERYLR